MKMPMRILVGIIGLVVVILGIKQMYKGVREMSGTAAPQAQKLGETYYSTENGYSHRIPQGWTRRQGQQPNVTMIVSPAESGVTSNMVTTVEKYDGSLADYVAANKVAVSKAAANAKFLSDDEFVTDGKATAHKVKLENKVHDTALAQTMYFFDGADGQKIIITCTAPAKYQKDLEPVFDGCMKTFAVR